MEIKYNLSYNNNEKKNLIILITLLLSFNAFPQDYIAFPDSGAVWKETYWWQPSPYGYNGIGDTFLQGDTIFNDTIYRNIYNLRRDVFCSDIIIEEPEYVAALREDTIRKKVYIRRSLDYPERLLYDYTLQVGDTIPEELYWLATYENVYVSYIDTITTEDSIPRKVWFFDHEIPFLGWHHIIEGIGSSSGLIGFIEPLFEGWDELLCFSVKGKTIWSIRESCYVVTDSCATMGVNQLLYPEPYVKFHPNPAKKISMIFFDLDQVYTENNNLWIYNIYGNEVKSLKFNKNSFTILSPENKGIYIIKIFVNNQYYTFKLLVSS